MVQEKINFLNDDIIRMEILGQTCIQQVQLFVQLLGIKGERCQHTQDESLTSHCYLTWLTAIMASVTVDTLIKKLAMNHLPV